MNQQEYEKIKSTHGSNLANYLISDEYKKDVKKHIFAYILHSMANQYHEEALEAFQKHGMNLFGMKYFANNLFKAFERYHVELKQLINNDIVFSADYDSLRKAFDQIIESGHVIQTAEEREENDNENRPEERTDSEQQNA